jgi:hypothetical protein
MEFLQRRGMLAGLVSLVTALAVVIALSLPVTPAAAHGGNQKCNSGTVSVSILSNCQNRHDNESSNASASCSSSASSSSSSDGAGSSRPSGRKAHSKSHR